VEAALHSITSELVLLGTHGEVMLCTAKEDMGTMAEPPSVTSQTGGGGGGSAASSSPLTLRRARTKLRIQPITTCQGLLEKKVDSKALLSSCPASF